MRTYDWLLFQIEQLMLREKEEHNIDKHESTLNQRARLLRQGGGGGGRGGGGGGSRNPKAVPGEVTKPFGSPDDIMKNGDRKGDTTCRLVVQGKICPHAGQGCPFSHKKPKAENAAPAQTGRGKGERSRSKTPKTGTGGKGRGKGRGTSDRSQTPAGARNPKKERTRSQSAQSRERQSKLVCYPFSRGSHNCRGPKDGCYKQHRALTAEEKLKRDKYEEAKLKAGKSLGYERTTQQANAAAANVQASPTGGRPRSTSSERRRAEGNGGGKGKAKGRGKGKDKVCRAFKDTGKCDRGKSCWFFATTTGHPQ